MPAKTELMELSAQYEPVGHALPAHFATHPQGLLGWLALAWWRIMHATFASRQSFNAFARIMVATTVPASPKTSALR